MALFSVQLVIRTLSLIGFWAVNGQNCPKGWEVFESSCYIYIKETYNWFDAKATCRVLGGLLVEIETAEENQFLAELVWNHGDTHPWIGLEDFAEEGIFVWATSRERPETTFWGQGEPDDTLTHEDCGGMLSTGTWFDGSCESDRRTFICEMSSSEETIVGR